MEGESIPEAGITPGTPKISKGAVGEALIHHQLWLSPVMER